ncbi:MAG: DUF2865 domain-containing protein [Hyphomicrobium sp.]
MPNWTALLSGAAALLVVVAVTPDAEAQSVFQKIFGFGGGSSAGPSDMPRPRQVIPAHRFQSRAAHRAYQSRSAPSDREDDMVGPPDSGGPYKTMCVRACDGFYFPLRHNARRKNFASDAKSCRNACGSDARLFYYSLHSAQGPDAMVDLSGKRYSDLPHAFGYRKALVQGCTCKPVPWSYEEAARHQSYADQEAIELAKDEAFLTARAAAEAKAIAMDASETKGAEATASPQPSISADAVTTATEIDVAAAVYKSIAANDVEVQPAEDARAETVKAAPVILPKATRRRTKTYLQRTSFKPASSSPFFGGKGKYVWPGDAR